MLNTVDIYRADVSSVSYDLFSMIIRVRIGFRRTVCG